MDCHLNIFGSFDPRMHKHYNTKIFQDNQMILRHINTKTNNAYLCPTALSDNLLKASTFVAKNINSLNDFCKRIIFIFTPRNLVLIEFLLQPQKTFLNKV